MSNKLLQAFSKGFAPEGVFNIVDWARDNVHVANSKRSDRADLSLTPWLIQPLQDILDYAYDDYNFVS
jgi:hypothetical protein